jgi:hypothetical protein
MSGCCDCGSAPTKSEVSPRYRRVLWVALVVNLAMFGVELASGWNAGADSSTVGQRIALHLSSESQDREQVIAGP